MDNKSKIFLDINRIHRELKLLGYSTLGHSVNDHIKLATMELERVKEILKKEIENI
jgi:hypothetical protein